MPGELFDLLGLGAFVGHEDHQSVVHGSAPSVVLAGAAGERILCGSAS
ncbi:hypothetical protein GCM10010335_09320 [Streptomyces galbus]|nr:hypothetical protein GCM10010335_09320 [Streptomyces galbus]